MSGWAQPIAAAAAPTIAIVVSRLLSHIEHRETARTVQEIKQAVNGTQTEVHSLVERDG